MKEEREGEATTHIAHKGRGGVQWLKKKKKRKEKDVLFSSVCTTGQYVLYLSLLFTYLQLLD